MKTTINQRIEMLRSHLNLTQQKFSDLIGITVGQLSRIENGKNEPQNGTIQQIFNNINVPREWLLDGTGTLEAQVISKESLDNNPWKDALVSQIKAENTRLNKEIERLWQMVSHYTSGVKPDFHKATDIANMFSLTTEKLVVGQA